MSHGMMCLLKLFAFLFAIPLLRAQNPIDEDVFSAIRRSDSSLTEAKVLHRAPVSDELDLVIAMGSPSHWEFGSGRFVWWAENRKLGLFFKDRAKPGQVYPLAIEPGAAECVIQIERTTATDTVISCTGEKSNRHPHQKFVYDARAKRLVHHFSYEPFSMLRVFDSPHGAVVVGTNRKRLVAVEFEPGRDPEFRVLGGPEARPWTSRLSAHLGALGKDGQRFLFVREEEFKPFRFPDSGRFELRRERGQSSEPHLVILETRGEATFRHPLPRSRSDVELDDRIGPWTLEDDKLWFGKTFYRGEGFFGIGGFGYFDTVRKTYQVFAPPEILDWSVSAIHVELEAVWMALVHNGEWGGSTGGLLRFDRRLKTVRKLELPDIGVQFVRVGSRLLLATDAGIAVVQENRIERYFVDQTADGRLRVVTAGL